MSTDTSEAGTPAAMASAVRVSIAPWVNETLPPWRELLSAHDIVRLTRRNRWQLAGLALLGRFPRKRKFRGRPVGWLRSDIVESIQILRLPQVCKVTGLGRSMIYLLESEQRFPKRIKIGMRAVGWVEGEVQAWLVRRMETSRASAYSAT